MISFSDLPTVNATLNATSMVLLVTGFVFIRRRRITAHKTCMLSAACVSVLFLTSYVTYHSLIPHSILAAVAVLPLAAVTIYFALTNRLHKHRRIARWTLPIWLYVSVTGVAVYLMLYHLV
jgi:putative membrane protein